MAHTIRSHAMISHEHRLIEAPKEAEVVVDPQTLGGENLLQNLRT